MKVEKLRFNNKELDRASLASGTLEVDGRGDLKATYSIHSKIAEFIGAELMTHEFTEVTLYDIIRRFINEDLLYGHKLSKPAISHNLNAESNGEYTKEHYLLKGYIGSDRLPAIDKVFTEEETDKYRLMTYTAQDWWTRKVKHLNGA